MSKLFLDSTCNLDRLSEEQSVWRVYSYLQTLKNFIFKKKNWKRTDMVDTRYSQYFWLILVTLITCLRLSELHGCLYVTVYMFSIVLRSGLFPGHSSTDTMHRKAALRHDLPPHGSAGVFYCGYNTITA